MTPEDILAMARKAGLYIRGHYYESGSTPQELERFAAIVAAATLAEGAMQRLTDVQQEMERKPLTEEEIDRAWRSVDYKISYDNFRIEVARAIERAHGIGGEK